MARIILLGELGEKFGSEHRLSVRSPAEAIRALDANFKNFRKYLLESARENVAYKIVVAGEELQTVGEIRFPTGRSDITFIPMVAGSAGKGFAIGEILVAAALVAAVILFPETAALAFTIAGSSFTVGGIATGIAISLALGGLAQIVAPQPKNNNTVAINNASYIYNGPTNGDALNSCVPVGYGRMIVGGKLASGGLTSDPVPSNLIPIDGGTEIVVPEPDLTNFELGTNYQTGAFSGFVAGGGGAGGKGGGSGTGGATEDPNTLQSHAYAQYIDVLCEGEIGGLANGAQSIYINGTPLQNPDGSFNFAGIAIYVTNGPQIQPAFPSLFNRTQNENVVGVQVLNSIPVIRTITDENVTSARVTIEVPSLTFQDPSNGDIHGSSVEIAIDVQTNSGGFVQMVDDVISGKTTSAYQREYVFALPAGGPPWDIRVRRISPDAVTINTQNETVWDSYTEIIDVNLTYPNTSLAMGMIDSASFTSAPTRGYDLYLLKVQVPSNYDPSTRNYVGVWDGTFKTAWSDNPAWAFYDMVTEKRYGLGTYVAADQVDKWELYKIAQYCDELVPDGLGGQSPRFTCNVYIQSQADAFKVLQDLASIFRGVPYWADSMVTCRQDAPADPVYTFSPANIIGQPSYQGSSSKARHTAVYVTWNNPQNMYQQEVEYVEDSAAVAKYGLIIANVVAMGCTNRAQAHRVGLWLIYVELHESDIVQFNTGIEGVALRPGDIFYLADPGRAGNRIGGRVHAADIVSVTMDSDYTVAPGSTIGAVLPDGTFQQVNILGQRGRTFDISPNWRIAPQPEAGWVVSQPALVPQQFRFLQGNETISKDGVVAITAISHNPSKYSYIEDNTTLDILPITNLSAAPAPVTGVTLLEQLYIYKDEYRSQVVLSWEASGNTITYDVSYMMNGGNWNDMPSQTSPSIDITGLEPGDYVFRIVAYDVLQHPSPPVTMHYTVLGNKLPPNDVQGFEIVLEANDLLLEWAANADVDLAGYEIRQGNTWDSGEVLITSFSGTSFKAIINEEGTYNFHIRAISTGGTYSENVMTQTITLNAPGPVSQFNAIQSSASIQFSWLRNPEQNIDGYEIREGTSWGVSSLIAQISATSYALPTQTTATRTFWIKAIMAPGIYSDVAEFSTTATAAPSNVNIVFSSDQAGGGFAAIKHFCSVVSGDLVLDANYQSGEYLFPVALPQTYTAHNSLLSTLAAVVDTGITWMTATFPWNSPNANQAWLPGGDNNSVSARFQMARSIGLMAGEIDGWNMDTTNSFNGVAATESVNVTYDAGRYNEGIVVTDITKVTWPVSVPTTFNFLFWFTPNAVTSSKIWTVTGSGISLELGYRQSSGAFFLVGTDGVEIDVPFSFAAGDLICLGIAQSSTTRTLYVGTFGGATASGSAAATPLGTFDTVKLYW